MEKYGIEHMANMGGQPEWNITDAEQRFCLREFFLNQPDSLDRFDACLAEIFIAAAERERKRVKNKVARLHAEFVDR